MEQSERLLVERALLDGTGKLGESVSGSGSFTEVEYDLHAFTWFEQEKMPAILVTQCNIAPISSIYDYNGIFNGLERDGPHFSDSRLSVLYLSDYATSGITNSPQNA
jgi:hypothetical protein